MSRVIDLLVVRENPCRAAGSLLETDRFAGRSRTPDRATAAFDEKQPDCVVVCTETVPLDLVVLTSATGVSVVDCTDDEPDRLEAAIRRTKSRAERGRITRLHESAAELVAVENQQALYDRTVELAIEVLDFDVSVLFIREQEHFRRAATTDDDVSEIRGADHGVTSQVYESGTSEIVDDVKQHPVADTYSSNYRSGIAVPFGDTGVFIGLSSVVGAFDETDIELAELLSSHAAQVDARLRAEADLRARQRTITELHKAAPDLIDAETEQELFERVTSIAERVLHFDRSSLFVRADGEFSVVAGHGEAVERVPPEGSILHRTHEEGESYLIQEISAVPEASPSYETTRSGLSVPIGDEAVFQALSAEPNAFTESDLELAELLAAYAGATLSRIRSERALRESREVIERLHDAAADIAAANTEAEVLDRSINAAEQILSFEKCAIVLRDGELLVPMAESTQSPDDAARPMALSEGVVGKTYRSGETYRIDKMGDESDAAPVKETYRSAISVPIADLGVFQAVDSTTSAFDDDDVHFAELLMAHVAVSLERVRAEADLRSQRDRLEALFENIPGAAIRYEMVDGEPVIRRVNSSFETTFGYDADTVLDEPLDSFIVPSDAEAEAKTYNKRLERGERIQEEIERETADGTRYFLLQVIPLSVGEENSIGYAIYNDVTEQREREATLRRQNERLEQFASVVSHDLRNPLNVAAGYLELSQNDGDTDHLDQVTAALERMDALVEDLLHLAREGQDVGETEPIELATVAATAWEHVHTGEATLQLETSSTVEVDEDRLGELFENLYRNSIEHGSGGDQAASEAVEQTGTGLTVTVSDIETDGRWQGFAVTDNGDGIDPSIDPFETGTTTSEEGTGFGLAIVKSIAEAHGWSVSATESEGGGARFEFRV